MRLDSQQRRQLHLLEWLLDEGGGGHDVASFYANLELSPDVARHDLRRLEALGFVDVYFAGGEVGRGTLKPDGQVHVEQLRRRRSAKLERRNACRSTLLLWLSQNGADSDGTRIGWDGLADDESNDFYGERFSSGEIDQAAAWLLSEGFIEGITVGQAAGPVSSWLTDLGLECVEQFDGDLAKLNTSRATGPHGGVTVVNYGYAQISTGDGVNQQMTVKVAVTEVRNEIRGLVEVLEAFDVGGLDELLPLYEVIVDEQAGSEDRQSRFERFGERLKGLAQQVSGDTRSAIVSLAVTQVLENLHSIVTSMH
jgi:hypothetical protein